MKIKIKKMRINTNNKLQNNRIFSIFDKGNGTDEDVQQRMQKVKDGFSCNLVLFGR